MAISNLNLNDGNPHVLTLTTPDRCKTRVNLFLPRGKSPKAVFLIWPAMGLRASYYAPLASELAEKGYVAATTELRGNGHHSIRPSRAVNFSYHTLFTQEFPTVIHYLKHHYPSLPLVLVGHSLGGQLSGLYASKYPTICDGLVFLAPAHQNHTAWPFPKNIGLLIAGRLINLVSWIFGYFPGYLFKFGGREAKGLLDDWTGILRTDQFRIQGDSTAFASQLQTLAKPMLTISFKADRLAPSVICDAFAKQFEASTHQRSHLGDESFEYLKPGHFRWIRQPKPVAKTVIAWAQQHLA